METRLAFVERMEAELKARVRHDKRSVEKLASQFGITDKTEVKECTELAIVRIARSIAHGPGSYQQQFDEIVKLYNNQVNLSHRTSHSILLQQYSTPAPIAFLMGLYTGAYRKDIKMLEPSAGNGMLTITALAENVWVNELDDLRRSNLESQGFFDVMAIDASESMEADWYHQFDVVHTNPPFGKLPHAVQFSTYKIQQLDHVMTIRALDTMKNDGKAAIIIGGHTRYDIEGRIQAGKNRLLLNYLYHFYHVDDVINIDGKRLYSRQGTSFDVRLILIAGRKEKASGAAPLRDGSRDFIIRSYDKLYERVTSNIKEMSRQPEQSTIKIANKVIINHLNKHYPGRKGIVTSLGKNPLTHEIIDVTVWIDDNTEVVVLPSHLVNLFWVSEEEEQMIEAEILALLYEKQWSDEGLGMAYHPASESCTVLETVVPDAMDYETHYSLERIKQAVGGDMDAFVIDRLGYPSKAALCDALSAEQIDAVALAIYNIEARKQGMVIGDQTGIGKGRVAAAMIRYGVEQGLQPIFITEKPNLFSDLYRDLVAIGSGDLVPFIINTQESKTDIKDAEGKVVHKALSAALQQAVFEQGVLPPRFHFTMATYSQFNSAEKKPLKPLFLRAIAEGNLIILDESHNASGSSNTGQFFRSVLSSTMGTVFLSATFAKRPDNMPLYAAKTVIGEANMTHESLVSAISRGGVALQEILASQLVAEGQMLRRERSFDGVEVNYITLHEKEQEHRAIADNITAIMRNIIRFQWRFVDKQISSMDKEVKEEGKQASRREGTSKAGVDNDPYFSKVFQVINQMLFSIKAESVAELAIQRLKEGKKPVIAFASTMGSFIEDMQNDEGLPAAAEDIVNADFSLVLLKGLNGVMRYTVVEPDGNRTYQSFTADELGVEAYIEYQRIYDDIQAISTGITISPIDVIIDKIERAGYTVAEVTGRKYQLDLIPKSNMGFIKARKRENTNDAFRKFNNNQVDVLLINQSGSTGASAHAIITPQVPRHEVKQRVMIVLQPELDINTEVQKRGRINRTGQIYKPIYDYVTSAIPAEMRLMMMLQRKLKSLDANTTSNQKQSSKILDVPDFLNKYGDKVVKEWLIENPEINTMLGDPLGLNKSKEDEVNLEELDAQNRAKQDAVHYVSGRVAVLSTAKQQDFYNDISAKYNEYVDYLKQIGEYDLEMEALDLQAETIGRQVVIVGKGSDSAFGDDSIMEKVRMNNLRKPYSKTELDNLLKDALGGKQPRELNDELLKEYEAFSSTHLDEEITRIYDSYGKKANNIHNESAVKKLKDDPDAMHKAYQQRERELEKERDKDIERTKEFLRGRKEYIVRLLNFYHPARPLNYPVNMIAAEQRAIPAVCVGITIDRKKKNPFAPSSIRIRIAIAGGLKYVALPASYAQELQSIMGASMSLAERSVTDTLTWWEQQIQSKVASREIGYIVTGNVLQAFSAFPGKLVSYTTQEGDIKKGILMPDYFDVSVKDDLKITVPVIRALKIIASLGIGSNIVIQPGIGIIRRSDDYEIIVSASRKAAGDIYLDKQLLDIVDGNNFQKTSDKMRATFPLESITAVVKILQENFSASVVLTNAQYNIIEKDIPARPVRTLPERKPKPPKAEPVQDELERELEMEALALEVELILLKFKP